jgi:hypothetical protein
MREKDLSAQAPQPRVQAGRVIAFKEYSEHPALFAARSENLEESVELRRIGLQESLRLSESPLGRLVYSECRGPLVATKRH